MAAFLNYKSKAIILIGNKGVETGLAVNLIKLKNRKKILDGWTVDLYGGYRKKERTLGIGVNKNIIENDLMEIGAGLYITKPLRNFLEKQNTNFCFGVSGKWLF